MPRRVYIVLIVSSLFAAISLLGCGQAPNTSEASRAREEARATMEAALARTPQPESSPAGNPPASPTPTPTTVPPPDSNSDGTAGGSQCPEINGVAGQVLSQGVCKYFFTTPTNVTVPEGWYADAYRTDGQTEYGIPAGTTIETIEMTLKQQSLTEAPPPGNDNQCPEVNGVVGNELSEGVCKYFFPQGATVVVPDGWYADAYRTDIGEAEYGIEAGRTIETNEMTLKVAPR